MISPNENTGGREPIDAKLVHVSIKTKTTFAVAKCKVFSSEPMTCPLCLKEFVGHHFCEHKAAEGT